MIDDFRGAVTAAERSAERLAERERHRKEVERNAKWIAEHAEECAEKKAAHLPLVDGSLSLFTERGLPFLMVLHSYLMGLDVHGLACESCSKSLRVGRS